MNTKQIVEKHIELLEEFREFEKALDVIYEEIGQHTKAYEIMKRLMEDKREELRKFSLIEWWNEE
jgi:hypothetical protein